MEVIMKRHANAEKPVETTEKKRPGRKPMTPEEREAAAKLRAAEKEKADNLKPVMILQYQGMDVDMVTLAAAAKADFHSQKKRTLVTDLKLYIKPEERTAYYVINENFNGKISFWFLWVQEKAPMMRIEL